MQGLLSTDAKTGSHTGPAILDEATDTSLAPFLIQDLLNLTMPNILPWECLPKKHSKKVLKLLFTCTLKTFCSPFCFG